MREIQWWSTPEELDKTFSATYWNDVEEERKKEWWIADGDYEKCMRYLTDSHLLAQFEEAGRRITEMPGSALRVVDIAAGIGWTSALLSRLPKVTEVHCVEISRHRLGPLFEHSFTMLGGEADKAFRYLGSFYDLRFPDRSMDVVFLSAAFHHAEKPFHLLLECDRILKDKGRIILIGEHYIHVFQIIKRFFSLLLRKGRVVTNFHEMFEPDPVLGDHHYRPSDYSFLFHTMGFKLRHRFFPNGNVVYIADKIS